MKPHPTPRTDGFVAAPPSARGSRTEAGGQAPRPPGSYTGASTKPATTAGRLAEALRSPRLRGWLAALALVAGVVLAYQPAWNAGFVWDDDYYVTDNPLLTAPDGLSRIWFSKDSPSQYFPLTYTTFRVQRALWGLDASGYHWVNLLLHAVNALLVWRLLRRLAVPGAWLAAAIFALHPVQVESVAWITELKNVQSLFFSLLALLAWVKFADGRPSWRMYAVAMACYILALFSKTTACTLPAALMLILWLKHRPIDRSRVAQVVPFFVVGLAMGLLTMWWERHHQGTAGEVFAFGPLERVLLASRAAWFYVGKLLWPANLSFSYVRWTIDPADPLAYGWLAAGAVLGVLILFARRSVGRSAEVAAVFFVTTLSPLLGVIMLYTFHYSFVADHYQYFAMVGPVALAAAAISRGTARLGKRMRLLTTTLCAALLATLGVLSWRQSRTYQNLETLWRSIIEKNPTSYLAHNNLSAVLIAEGKQLDEAIAHAHTALTFEPKGGDYALSHINLGNAFLQLGRLDEAINHYQQSMEGYAGFANAHNNLGQALLQAGRANEAITHFEKALEIQPDDADGHNNLGNALLQKGRADEAIAHYRRALEIQPAHAKAHNNLGWTLFHVGQEDEAVEHLRKAVELQPDYANAHSHLAEVLQQRGRLGEAVVHFQKAAAAYAANGQSTEAEQAAQQALQLADAQPNPAQAGAQPPPFAGYQAGPPEHALDRKEPPARKTEP